MAGVDDLMEELCGVSLTAMESAGEAEQVVLQDGFVAVARAVLESDAARVRSQGEALRSHASLANVHAEVDAAVSGALAMAALICEGEYAAVVRLPRAQALLDAVELFRREEAQAAGDADASNEHVCGCLRRALQRVLLERSASEEARLVAGYELLFLGVAVFSMYVQANYTGPAFEREALRDVLTLSARVLWPSTAHDDDKQMHAAALVALQVDGESPYSICEYPQLLLLGRCLLSFVGDHEFDDWSVAFDAAVTFDPDADVDNGEAQGPAPRPASDDAAVRTLQELLARVASASWWDARAAVAHERLLLAKQPSVTLWFEARRGYLRTLAQQSTALLAAATPTEPPYLLARAYVEWGLAQHHFDKHKRGKRTFEHAQLVSKLRVQMSGSMGKRTKFQQKSTAQMLLLAASEAPPAGDGSTYAAAVAESARVGLDDPQTPVDGGLTHEEDAIQQLVQTGEAVYRDVNLDQVDPDNILLEAIAFEEEDDAQWQRRLRVEDQLVLLALCLDVRNSNGNDGLTREEMFPYVTRVLEEPSNWMVTSTALLERAWLECETSKRRERAVLQMQALVDQHTTRLTVTQHSLRAIADAAPARERMQFVHALAFPPRYALKRDLTERYFAIGVLGSARALCEELELWDDVVRCYQLLDQPARAEKLVRARLAVAPTPYMLVCLGDLTQQPEHYEEAWALSQCRFARAKRSLGRYFFEQGELETAIPHYEASVRAAPMHTGAWFTLGALAMRTQRWTLALRAFTRVVQLEPDNGEAWGNLGSIHLSNQRFPEAFAVLQEALKQKRHLWQMWENYALCAMETRRYGEAMYAMHQLLDMRAKHKRRVDHEMLAWLVEAIVYPESLQRMEQQADAEAKALAGKPEAQDEDEDEQDLEEEDLAELDEAAVATDATPPRSDAQYKKQLALLFGRVTAVVTNDAKIWQVYAHFNDGLDARQDKARDCRLKQCRALQQAGWEREQERVEELCRAAARLAQDYMREGTKKALYSCRLYVRGVLRKAQVDFAQLEAVRALQATLDDVSKMEAQL